MLEVVRSGPLSTLQDLGRFGVARFGLSQGGPMDIHAFCWANKLIDNPPNTAAIEIAIGLCQFTFHAPTIIALCGAPAKLTLNAKPIQPWQSIRIQAGDQLTIAGFSSGNYLYLALKSGFTIPMSLNSLSTVCRNGLGGLNGHALSSGDMLPYPAYTQHCSVKALSPRWIPNYLKPTAMGVILGYQHDSFDPDSMQTFFNSNYQVQSQSNRMGYLLKGEPLRYTKQGLISEGIVLGAIQVPPDGQPIILFNDRQTIGGYPKLGTVRKIDLAKLAQCQPSQNIHFYPSSLTVAQDKWHHFCQFFGIK
ncbi:biotin-dependent carboxyltransferase family protein [Thaumasiovibrio sp. DFM-14]|uniref:5-oxoprolinase subunit C family protein n=1 Tax=Thaumasiovibrio sp. DFM-14 TaxID=3384792 RepID=UPI0039A20CC2